MNCKLATCIFHHNLILPYHFMAALCSLGGRFVVCSAHPCNRIHTPQLSADFLETEQNKQHGKMRLNHRRDLTIAENNLSFYYHCNSVLFSVEEQTYSRTNCAKRGKTRINQIDRGPIKMDQGHTETGGHSSWQSDLVGRGGGMVSAPSPENCKNLSFL